MELIPPECADDKLTPCSSKDRVQCDKCFKYVCEVHDDELIQVFHLESGEYGRSDMICRSCFNFGRYMGDITTRRENEYTHF
jgi:hypothetical protein